MLSFIEFLKETVSPEQLKPGTKVIMVHGDQEVEGEVVGNIDLDKEEVEVKTIDKDDAHKMNFKDLKLKK